MRVIKKYQNRRLYDTETSTYVILEDIKEMIIGGDEIKVIDLKSDEDVTRSVLLQIILDEEINGVPIFSNEFLYQIIRFYGKALQASLGPFLEQGLDLFRQLQKDFYLQIRDVYGKEGLPAGVQLWRQFLSQQLPELEEMITSQAQANANVFLQMHEHLQKQTRNIFDYMHFPFTVKKKN